MDKAFPVILIIIALGIVIYTLPQFAASFNLGSTSNQTNLLSIVFASDNNGKTFDKTYWSGNTASTIYDFEVDGDNPSFVYAATDKGLFMSRDNGTHWYTYSDLEGLLTKATVYQIQKATDNSGRFFVSLFKNGQGGVYETGDRFFTLKKIFDAQKTTAYKLVSSGNNLYIGLSDGRVVGYSLTDSGFRLLGAVGSPVTDIVVNDTKIYVATKAKKIWIGSTSGNNLIPLEEQQPSQSAYTASLLGADLSTVVAKDSVRTILPDNQGNIYLAAADKLYRSNNQGRSWQLILDVSGRQVSSLNLGTNGRILVGTGGK